MASGPYCAPRWPSSDGRRASLAPAPYSASTSRCAAMTTASPSSRLPLRPRPRPPPRRPALLWAEVLAGGLRFVLEPPPARPFPSASSGRLPSPTLRPPVDLLCEHGGKLFQDGTHGGDDGSSPEMRTRGLLGWWPPRQGQGGRRPGVGRGPHSLRRGACQLPDEVKTRCCYVHGCDCSDHLLQQRLRFQY